MTDKSFTIMAKPVGPVCNLACEYCYYTEKQALFPGGGKMSDAVLEEFTRQYIASRPMGEIQFAWQGGEPTLAGLDFFRRALELQRKYGRDRRITNAIQTNGTLLDEDWGRFLADNGFLVGLSLDGPERLHDRFRKDRQGRPTFERVMAGLEVLKRHRVEFNTLTVLSHLNADHPLEVYRFLKDAGSRFMQFIPLVERRGDGASGELGLDLSLPPDASPGRAGDVTTWSVRPDQLARFYTAVFDDWLRADVGRIFVQFFDVALANFTGRGPGLCQFAPTCGQAPLLEADGGLYACDHYVYPGYRLGNILERDVAEMMADPAQVDFGRAKRTGLADRCVRCRHLKLCHGDCPKHRFARDRNGRAGLSYLCPAMEAIFDHLTPGLEVMARLLAAGRAPAGVMDWARERDRQERFKAAGRNDPCPCGSGRKFKKCCGKGR